MKGVMASGSSEPLRRIGFVVNATKDGAQVCAQNLVEIAEGCGVETRVTHDYPPNPDFVAGLDACCAVGGDGTLLGMMRGAVKHGVPVLGINLGKLGFLATFSRNEAEDKLPRLFSGEYRISQRSLLEFELPDGHTVLALNDIVVKSADQFGLIELEVSTGSARVTGYACDGLIFSTPTGSTAYNLSAGGPLIHPQADVFAMTPICPHTLSNRSVIFAASTELSINCRQHSREASLSADGQSIVTDTSGIFPLRVRKSVQRFPLMQFSEVEHFAVVRNKLKW